MPEPLTQVLRSVYDSAPVKAYIADLERIAKLQKETGRPPSASGRNETAQTKALRELRQTMAEARVEFDRYRQANRRGEISNKDFAESVERMRLRTGKALDLIRKDFQEVPRAVKIALGRAENQLTQFQATANRAGTGGLGRSIADGLKSAFSATGLVLGGILTLTAGIRRLTRAFGETGTEFERVMSRVRALSQSTDEAFQRQTETVRTLGATTVFSATQAAEGMALLAQAGFSVDEQIKALPGTLGLAASGQLDLASATDITAKTIRGFNLDAAEANRVSDVLAATSTRSNTTVRSLGDTMKYVAPIAAGLKIPLEEVAAAAGLLGDAGIQGEMGGTVLRGILVRLTKPTRDVEAGLKAAGVQATDAAGRMRSLTDIIAGLEKGTRRMTEAERNKVFAQVAGLRAVSGLIALTNRGSEELARFTDELENSGGAAQRLADEQLNNLSGDMRLLRSAAEELALTLFDKVKGGLRAGTQAATAFITSINDLSRTAGELEAQYKDTLSEIARLGELQKAVEVYEALREKKERTTEESRRFEQAITDLEAAFPGYISQTDEAGRAVGFYTDRVRDAIKAQRDFQLALQQATIQDLAAQYESYSSRAERARLEQQAFNRAIDDFDGQQVARGYGVAGETLGSLEDKMRSSGEQAIQFEALTRRSASALVSLFQTADGIDLDGLAQALVSPSRSMEEATRLARELASAWQSLQLGAPSAPPPPGGGGGGGGGAGDITRQVKQAEEFLRKSAEAAEIAVRFTDREKKALTEIFKIQEEINRLKEAEKLLGEEATREAIAGANTRLVAAQVELAKAEEFRAKIKKAADSFSTLLREQQILEGAGLQSLPGRLVGLQPRGLDNALSEAARRRRIEEAKARKERKAAHEEAMKFTDAELDAQKELEEQTKKNTEAWTTSREVLEDLAATVDGLVRLVDVFGDLSEETRRAAAGIADALDAAARVRELTASEASSLQIAPGILGIMSGIATVFSSLASVLQRAQARADERELEQIKAMRALREALKENARKVAEAIDRLVNVTQFGADLTGQQAQVAAEAIRQYLAQAAASRAQIDYLRAQNIPGVEIAIQEIERALAQTLGQLLTTLRAQGIDLQGMPTEEDLARLLAALSSQGEFADTVTGALEQFRLLVEFLRLEGQPAYAEFLKALEKIRGLPEGFLNQLRGLDVSTPEGRAQLDALLASIATAMASGGFDFGQVTPDEFRQVLDALRDFTEGGAFIGADGTTAASAGLQRQVQITEVQANAFLAGINALALYMRQAVFYLEQIATRLGAPALPPLPVPQAPAFAATPVFTAPQIDAIRRAGTSGGVSADFSGWRVERPLREGDVETARIISRMVYDQYIRLGRRL